MNPKTSQDLFNKIRSQFSNIQVGDESGLPTADPSSAVFFEFEFKEDADTYGAVSVSLADGENMKVFYNRNLVDKIDEDSKDEWYAFLKELKDFAVEHQLAFDVRDITKSNLTKQDYQNLADTNKTVNTDEMSEELNRITKLAGVEVKEGLTGTARRSYEDLEKTRLIVRHSGKVDEEIPGSRSRHIESLYIENEDGERFKYPLTHLAGARAMQRHVANGGRPHDEFGEHIVKTSEDIAKLNSFSRYVSHKDQLNDNAGDIIEKTKLQLENLREYIRNISKQPHYEAASKDFKTSDEIVLDDETIAKLREKFTMKNLDNRVEDALPLINRIMTDLEAPKEAPVTELDPGDEPIDAPVEPAVDHAMVVKQFLANPDSRIMLNKNMPDEKKFDVPNATPEDTRIMTTLSDIASRMLTKTPDEDRVANFASRVADQMSKTGMPFDPEDPDANKNRDIAKALVAKYDKASEEIDPADFKAKKDIKGKAKETQTFEDWVNDTIAPFEPATEDEGGKEGFEYPEDGTYGYKAERGSGDGPMGTTTDVTLHNRETNEVMDIKDLSYLEFAHETKQETLAMIWDENKDLITKESAPDPDAEKADAARGMWASSKEIQSRFKTWQDFMNSEDFDEWLDDKFREDQSDVGNYAREIATGKIVRIVDYTDDDEGIYTISYGDGKGETDVVAKDLKFKDPTSYWSDEETTEGANLNPYFLTKKEFDGKMRDVWDFPDGYGDEDDSPYLSNFSMRDVLNSLGLDPNFEDAGPIEINKFINITTQWLKKNINKPSAEVPTTVDKSGGGATMIGGGKPEGYENKVIMGFNQFARSIKQKYPKVTHIGIA